MKAKIFTLYKQGNLTYQSFDNLKKVAIAIIKAEVKQQEYIHGNKRVVEWEDPDFKKAFIEIYFPNQLRESGFIKA